MQELDLLKVKLQYQQRLHEKNIAGASAKIIDNFSDSIRNIAFDLGTSVVARLISGLNKKN